MEKDGMDWEEYFNNNLIFKGEYLIGERNEKGKGYYSDEYLKFEGIYKNGEIWNRKGYIKKGKIEFEIIDGKGNVKIL